MNCATESCWICKGFRYILILLGYVGICATELLRKFIKFEFFQSFTNVDGTTIIAHNMKTETNIYLKAMLYFHYYNGEPFSL